MVDPNPAEMESKPMLNIEIQLNHAGKAFIRTDTVVDPALVISSQTD